MNKNTSNNTGWKIAAGLLGLFILLALAGLVLLFVWPSGNGGKSSAIKKSGSELQATAPLEAETQTKAQIVIAGSGEVAVSEETADEGDALTGDYIIPDSNSKLLTDSDIEGLSAKELNYAKNEIYARHGRKFDSAELQSYFDSKSWYSGVYSPSEFDAESGSLLNETEKKNAEFLKDAENELAPGGYQLDQ